VFLCGVGVRIGSKRILTPEAADLPTFHETVDREHTPIAPALTSEPVTPVQTLVDPRQNVSGRHTPNLPIVVAPVAPPLANGPELHPSLPPATFDVQAELDEPTGEVPSLVARRSVRGMRWRAPPGDACLSGGPR
jgi:hypothetical protein